MRRDVDGDQQRRRRIAVRGRPALPLQPDRLAARSTPAGILTSTSLPVGSCTRFLVPLAASSSDTVMVNVDVQIGADRRRNPRARTAAAASRAAARRAPRRRTCCAGCPRTPPPPAPPRAAAALEAVGTEAEALEMPPPDPKPAPPPGAASPEALEARLALGIDLAAVERLALLLVADDLVGGVQLGKARRPPWDRACWRRDAASWRACDRRS